MSVIRLWPSPMRWWTAPLAMVLGLVVMVALQVSGLPGQVTQNLQFIGFAALASLLPRFFVSRVEPKHVGLSIAGDRFWRRLAMGVVFGVAALHANAVLFLRSSDAAAQSPVEVVKALGFGQSPGQDIWLVITTTIMAPIGEEAFYRGLIFRGLFDGLRNLAGTAAGILSSPPVSLGLALLLSSIAFADAHGGRGQDAQYYALLVTGIIYALIFAISGSLLAAILAHCVNNCLGVFMALMAADIALPMAATIVLFAAPVITLALVFLWQSLLARPARLDVAP